MLEVVRSYIRNTGAFEEPSGGAVSKIGGVKDAQCGVFPEFCSRPHKLACGGNLSYPDESDRR